MLEVSSFKLKCTRVGHILPMQNICGCIFRQVYVFLTMISSLLPMGFQVRIPTCTD